MTTLPDVIEVVAPTIPEVVEVIVPGPQGTPTIPQELRAKDFRSRAEAIAYSIDPFTGHVRTAGYASAGDLGGALYKRVVAQPAHIGKFQSADGTWWEITEDVLSLKSLGAKGDDATNDAPVVQDAQAVAKKLLFPIGEYRMVPNSVSPFYYANSPSNLIYRAVALTVNDMVFDGKGAILHGVSRAGVQVADIQPIFSTDKNTNVGDIKDLRFENFAFDSENNDDLTNSNQRLFYIVGLQGGRFNNLKGMSSGNRRGYLSHIHNSADLHIDGYRHSKVTGGWNFRFVKRIVFTNFLFFDFSEALDFDGTQDQLLLWGGHFESTSRVNQCIDLNSQVDAIVGGFSVRNVGNIITINHKTTTPDNYPDYVSNAFVKNQSNSQRIIIGDIVGSAAGGASAPSIFIGWDWSAGSLAGKGPVRNITLHDIDLRDIGSFFVRGVTGLSIRNVKLEDVQSADGFAALHLLSHTSNSDQISWDDLDVEISNLTIKNAQRGSLLATTPRFLNLFGLKTEGGNTLGGVVADLTLSNLHIRSARVQIDGCDIEGTVVINGSSTSIGNWAADTLYKKNAVVKNDGGKFYRAKTEGKSASSGGPTGTALAILDDGRASISAWAPSTSYVVDNVVSNGGSYFICFTAGTSAGSGGPSTQDQFIQDGTVVWRPITGSVTWEYLTFPYAIRWGNNNRVRGGVTLQGDAGKFIFGDGTSSLIGDIPATGSVNHVMFAAKRRTLVTSVAYTSRANVIANDTNFRSVILRRSRAGVTTNIGTINTNIAGGNWDAFVPKDGGATGTEAGAVLEPGDLIIVNSNSNASGVAIQGLCATVNYIEH